MARCNAPAKIEPNASTILALSLSLTHFLTLNCYFNCAKLCNTQCARESETKKRANVDFLSHTFSRVKLDKIIQLHKFNSSRYSHSLDL